MTTYSDLIEETLRRIQPAQIDVSCQLVTPITNATPGATVTFTVGGQMTNAISFGMVLSIDMENFYVTQWAPMPQTVTAISGYQGSTSTSHLAGATVYINPKFSRFDVGVAINEELTDLSGPTNGLFQVKTDDITYNPVFMGYDLPADSGLIDVIGVRYKIAPPTHNYPPIKRWALLPNMTDPVFPSHNALIIYEGGWPGMPLHVWYSSAFDPLTSLSDDVTTTAGVPPTAIDIIPVGAGIILNQDREIKRNFAEAQPDARKAPEVPPGAVMNATKQMQAWRAGRVASERTRLQKKYRYLKVKP